MRRASWTQPREMWRDVAFFGLVEDAFQAELEEVQFIQERGLMALMGLIRGVVQGPAQMLGVAGQRRDGKPVLGGQGTQGLSGHQGAVDLL